MRALIRAMALAAATLACGSAAAQVVDPELFGDGHMPVYREEETDRRFQKSGIATALENPPAEPACRRVVASLLVAYAEALPYLHRKDQNFYCDPALLQTLTRTLTTRDFPANAFLAAMIRRTLLDKKVPAPWLATAERLRVELQAPIATARMQLFATGVQPIDSFAFTVPALLDRYRREVKLATSIAVDAAEDRFRDQYMDRDVAWGGLVLHDIAKEAPPEPPRKGKGRGKAKGQARKEAALAAATELPTWAVVGFPVGPPQPAVPAVLGGGGGAAPQLEIRARLKDGQPLDLTRFVRGSRVLVKGHLWDIAPNMAWVEIRDAVLLPDPAWNDWPGLASPRDVLACPIAVNDLSPYGFQKRPAPVQAPNPYEHKRD